MNSRRDFLGFLGNACFVGSVVQKEGITRPALAVPRWVTPVLTREPPVADPAQHPLLAAAGSQANAMMQIRAGVPDSLSSTSSKAACAMPSSSRGGTRRPWMA